MAFSTLTSKGQVTIPKKIRLRMGLRAGDRLDFRLEEGRLIVRPAGQPSYLRLFGFLDHRAGEQPVAVEEMREAVRRRTAQKQGRQE